MRNINSVRRQTYGNYEHIIVDDGNDPATARIVQDFCDERLILLTHKMPRGAAASYNSGIKKSRGEFITFLDDDDEYLPEFLEKMDRQYRIAPSDIGFIWSGIERVCDLENGQEQILRKFIWPAVFSDPESGLALATSIGNGFGVCVRKKCI
ncbi:MAG TPA: glycosyltransferase family A protein, partial [Bacteroidales bacterium]|nr:glycosyltransferase family A protein [Bacteroidales bacterium]